MKATVILVQPEYAGNIGFVARAMANFGLTKLVLVKPKANHLSGEAKSRAMRAKNILQKAKIVNSLEKALERVDFCAATTAKITSPKKIPRTALSAREFAERFSESDTSVGIVFGSEKNGLTNREINKCDFILHIPVSSKYKPLNLSHAATVIFYELFQAGKERKFKSPNRKLKENLIRQFKEMLESGGRIRNRQDTLNSFKALIARTPISEKEAKAIMAVFGSVLKYKQRKPKN